MLLLDTRFLNSWAVFCSSLYCLPVKWPNHPHFDYDRSVAFREHEGMKANALVNWGAATLLTEEGENDAGLQERGQGTW